MCKYCIEAFNVLFFAEACGDSENDLINFQNLKLPNEPFAGDVNITYDDDSDSFNLELYLCNPYVSGFDNNVSFKKKINYCPVCGQKLTITEVD